MPLMSGYSREAMSKNISREVKGGRPQKQAIAIAYSKAKESARKSPKSKRSAILRMLQKKKK